MMTSHIPANLDTFLQSLNGIAFYAPSCFSLVLRLSRQSMLEEDWHHGTIPFTGNPCGPRAAVILRTRSRCSWMNRLVGSSSVRKHRRPCGRRCMTRGQCGWLDPQCIKLSFTTLCRFNRRTEKLHAQQTRSTAPIIPPGEL